MKLFTMISAAVRVQVPIAARARGAVLFAGLLAGCSAAPQAARMVAPEWAAASADASARGTMLADGRLEDATLHGDGLPRTPAAPPAAEANDFLRPYLWAAGVEGDVTVKGTTADVDESFSDVLDQLDLGLMLAYEHRFEDDWSLLADFFYTRLEEDTEVNGTDVDSTIELAYLEVAGAMPLDGPGSVEGIAGLRTWYSKVELDVGATGGSQSNDWVDPIVGARWATPLGGDWTLHLRGDVGGFGIGSASDFTWLGQAIAACPVGEQTSLAIGYRYLNVDRERGSGADERGVDLSLQGLLVGMEFRY